MSHFITLSTIAEVEEFKQKYSRSVIIFGADWCDGCAQILPLFKRIANRYHKRVAMAYVDIDKAKIALGAIPTFISFYKGFQTDYMEGGNDYRLKQFVKRIIKFTG